MDGARLETDYQTNTRTYYIVGSVATRVFGFGFELRLRVSEMLNQANA